VKRQPLAPIRAREGGKGVADLFGDADGGWRLCKLGFPYVAERGRQPATAATITI
jgi:hypothetical protein